MSVVKYCLLLTSLFLFAGCTVTGATYESQLYNVREIENSLRASLAVGEFTRSESEKVVDPWSFRGATKVASPVGDGYHDLIAKGIEDDLMLARRLDSKSNLVLTGDLTEHLVDASSMSTGEGVVGMTFTLSDSGKVVYLKPVRIVHEWDSSFLGQTAANNAMRAHVEMIERLIASLFKTENFLGQLMVMAALVMNSFCGVHHSPIRIPTTAERHAATTRAHRIKRVFNIDVDIQAYTHWAESVEWRPSPVIRTRALSTDLRPLSREGTGNAARPFF